MGLKVRVMLCVGWWVNRWVSMNISVVDDILLKLVSIVCELVNVFGLSVSVVLIVLRIDCFLVWIV